MFLFRTSEIPRGPKYLGGPWEVLNTRGPWLVV